MLPRRAIGALATAVFASCAAPVSAAASAGVYPDPGSPAGKEYSIPLWTLRGEGSGHQSPQGVPPAPLFGVGIGPANTAGSGRAGRGGRGGGAGTGRAATRASGPGSAATNAQDGSLSPAAIAQLTRQGSATSQVALIVAAVLAGGLALGAAFALGRRRATS
jgi:hypothetical protein